MGLFWEGESKIKFFQSEGITWQLFLDVELAIETLILSRLFCLSTTSLYP